MALTGDRYVGTYKGHTVELFRNKWFKALSLWIDGKRVALDLSIWPWPTTLTGSLAHEGRTHAVVARSTPHLIWWTTDTIEVDGEPLTLEKVY